MTGHSLVADVYLALMAIGLLFVGGLITWPVARRIGERRPDPWLWIPVETPAGREWHRNVPRQPGWRQPRRQPRHLRHAWRERVAAWWASTAPRDVDAPVRAAMTAAAGSPPPWLVA